MASRFEAEKFTGRNDFGLWRMKMRAMLIHQGLASALEAKGDGDKSKEGGEKKGDLEEKEILKRAEIEAKAHSAIVLCLGDKVLREVAKEGTAAGILSKLEDLYMAKSLANRLLMKQRLYSYRFLDDKGILEQLEDFNKAIDDLENIDASIGDEDKAILLLNALPKSFDQLRDAILYGREGTITLVEVQSAIRAKELQRSGSKNAEAVAESLNVKKFKGVKKFQKPSQEVQKTPSNDQKETRSCHWCKKPGHLKKDCFAWKRRQANGGGNRVPSTDCVEESDAPEILNVMEGSLGGSWIMDSGCSLHMSPNLGWFEEIQEMTGSVILGNNQVCTIQGIGKIRLRMHDGSVKIISEVRYIPDIKRNLISLGLLERKGYTFCSTGGKMTVSKDKRVVMEAERRGNLYYLLADVELPNAEANIVKADDFRVWHMRLAHAAEGSIKELVNKGVIQSSGQLDTTPCEECILGKSKKLPYPKGKHTSTSILDYAHSDLWGPASVVSVGGGKYYMSIIDDYSRKMWIYILKEKSEAFSRFKQWCLEVEKEKAVTLKYLRTDNGLEYLSKEFDDFCRERGIKRHRTVPLNPQQNGIAERANRTIMERVRCMLLSSGLEKKFWAEAASTAVRLINKCPSSSIEGDTPDFRWYGSHGDYTTLRVFGCKAYAHIKQGKLDARAIRCVMLGYQPGVKGYRLWCVEPGNHKIVISRDVVFSELEMPLLNKGRVVNDKPVAAVESADKVELEVEHERDKENGESKNITDSQDSQDNTEVRAQGDLRNYQLARDRARRQTRLPSRLDDSEMLFYALCVAEDIEYTEPSSYKQAMQSKEWEKWMKAMVDEIDSLLKNGTWILVERPDGRKIVSCKWIFKKKLEGAEGDQIRFKARLVARGFTQEHGVDFTEVFSPVVKHSSIRMLLALVARLDLELEQLDVKTAFLHGGLEETIYMAQPEGFIKPGDETKVCLLKRSLYGLKQASRQWNKTFDDYMMKIGFQRSSYDSCVYVRKGKEHPTYLLLYVDDMLVAGASKKAVQEVKDELNAAFEMKDLGPARRILGMNIVRDRAKRQLWLSQSDYISKLLRRFKVENMKAVATPLAMHFKLKADQRPKSEAESREMEKIPYASIVGSIMYAMISTRADIAQATSVVSRFMANHGKEHWIALRWLMRYLRGAGDVGILYGVNDEGGADAIVGYCDSDFAGNLDNRKSQSAYIFTMFGSAISWKSSLQGVVALSTTEAEFISLAAAIKESFWLKGMLSDLGIEQRAIAVGCDNNSALFLAKHQAYHERSKHIDVRYHFIREEIERGNVKVFKVHTSENPADMLTKPLPKEKFLLCLKLVGLERKSLVGD